MNEAMSLYLDRNGRDPDENEALIKKIDGLLVNVGIEYSGFQNIYRPMEQRNRDHAVFAAQQALRNAVWLKDELKGICIMNMTNAYSLDEIRTDHMSEPSLEKLKYYEEYYQTFHKLAHGIVTDEKGQLRDGYTSYIIARKYGEQPDIYETFAKEPLRKVVRGHHVEQKGDTWRIKSHKRYSWNYTLKKAVVPGDILKVRTSKGWAFMCVDRIDYVTGAEFCREHRKVKEHMLCRQGICER